VVPETCWASNKICNKNHLLHLVGVLFPHITCLYWIVQEMIKKANPTYLRICYF